MSNELNVIYNDTCPICAREVDMYKTATEKSGAPVVFSGLSVCDLSSLGVNQDMAARRFHVVKNGTLIEGIPAFAELWDTIPRMRWLARVVKLPVVRSLAAWVYDRILAPTLYAMHKRRVKKGTARHIA